MFNRFLGVLCVLGYSTFAPVAQATSYVVSDETSCLALPVSTVWSGTACDLGADLTLNSGDMLTVDVRMFTTSGAMVINKGGDISLNATMSVFISNQYGGLVTNNHFWPAGFFNDAKSEIVNHNQLGFGLGFGSSSENAGTLTNNGSIQKTIPSILVNSGSIANSATGTINLTRNGEIENSGTITNNGVIRIGCGTITGAGTITGNALEITWCWVGNVAGNFWNEPANWKSNSVPPNNAEIYVKGGPTAVINTDVLIEGKLFLALGAITINPGASLTNDGFINIELTGPPPRAQITNFGSYINNGSITVADTFVNHGTYSNFGSADGNGTTQNFELLENYPGGFFNSGFRNEPGGEIHNFGRATTNRFLNTNAGLLLTTAGSVWTFNNNIQNLPGGVIDNSGTFNVTAKLTFPGGILNNTNATIFNRDAGLIDVTEPGSFITNDGFIANLGSISNSGEIQNNGIICGKEVTGNAVNGNPVEVGC